MGFSRMGALAMGTALASLSVLRVPDAEGGEVVEKFDGGATKAKYSTNDQGQKDGAYLEYYETGKVRVRATYRAGKLNGKWEELSPDGDIEYEATYVEDKLNGKAEVSRARKPLSVQTWRDGELVTLEGSPAHPKSREAMDKTLRAIASGGVGAKAAPKGRSKPTRQPAPPSPAAKGDEQLEKYRVASLRRLQAFRYLCDVPYADLVLGDDAVAHAQAASELCAKLGRIDHEPPNPGLPEAEYRFGFAGTKHCNLGGPGADDDCVTGLMNDSDASNINRVGHRRWCLDPAMGITGFGKAGEPGKVFTAMWAMDSSRQPVPDYDAICYPTRGWMPIEMFGPQHAWSVELNPVRFPRAPQSGVQVRIFKLDTRFVRAEKPLEIEYFKIDVQEIAVPYCIIFRPKDLELTDGAAYFVEIAGVDPKTKKGGADLRYLVHFYSRPEAAKEGDVEEK